MKINTIAYIWGVANFAALQFPIQISNQLIVIIPILSVASTLFFKTRNAKWLFFIAIFFLSFFWTSYYAKQRLASLVPKQLESKWLKYDVVIDEVIKQTNKEDLLVVTAKQQEWKGRALIYVNETLKNSFKVGQIWRMSLKLKRPHGLANPYLFRSELFYLESNIQALGTIQKHAPIILLSENKPWLKSLRYYFQEQIFSLLNNSVEANFISALTLGHLQNFDFNQKRILQKTGTSHLLAISGLHVGLIVLFSHFYVKTLLRSFPILFLYFPLSKLSAVFSIFISFFYAILSGFSLPTQRAFIMLSVVLLARCFTRSVSKWQSLALAVILVLLIDPLAIMSCSFWLSFFAVVIIFLNSEVKFTSKLKQLLIWQSILTISLMPLVLYFFHSFSFVGIVANLIAIPTVAYVVLPISLLAIIFFSFKLSIAKILLLISTYSLKLLWQYLTFLSQINYLQWQPPHIPFFIFLLLILSCTLFSFHKLKNKRYAALLGFIPLFFISPISPNANQLFLYVLDVGQGLAIVIQTEKHVLLYDTGLKIQDNFDAGKTIVAPFLQQLGVKEIDKVIISHDDIDHSGGLSSISKQFLIKELLSSKHKNYVSNIETRWCFKDERWSWDGIEFEFLHPDIKYLNDENNGSCVLKISNKAASILVPGDIESDAEKTLIKNNFSKLASQILIAPHHGSKTSSISPFLEAVNPQYIVISSGYLNRFHFPHPVVLDRYKKLKAKIFNTAEQGAVTIKVDENKIIEISSERIKSKKFFDD